ncbi:PH domain-containing protein [Candidatus Daviesbacteria bacterium]|nr:PH domain-containing protein [Candidatus Daviesbacteria bacterium]
MAKLHYKEFAPEEDKKTFAKYLAEDEELVLATGLSKVYLRSRLIVGLLWPGIIFILMGLGLAYFLKFNLITGLIIGLVAALVVSFAKTILTYHAHRYLLTTRRVIIKKGFFAVNLTTALFDKITHIEVEQPFLDKILMHHGTVIINTAGMNKGEITLKYLDHPIEFKNILERLINREREQLGVRTGPVVTLEGEVV